MIDVMQAAKHGLPNDLPIVRFPIVRFPIVRFPIVRFGDW
jgi:hypothetical protein